MLSFKVLPRDNKISIQGFLNILKLQRLKLDTKHQLQNLFHVSNMKRKGIYVNIVLVIHHYIRSRTYLFWSLFDDTATHHTLARCRLVRCVVGLLFASHCVLSHDNSHKSNKTLLIMCTWQILVWESCSASILHGHVPKAHLLDSGWPCMKWSNSSGIMSGNCAPSMSVSSWFRSCSCQDMWMIEPCSYHRFGQLLLGKCRHSSFSLVLASNPLPMR